jgi:hypothetical protein
LSHTHSWFQGPSLLLAMKAPAEGYPWPSLSLSPVLASQGRTVGLAATRAVCEHYPKASLPLLAQSGGVSRFPLTRSDLQLMDSALALLADAAADELKAQKDKRKTASGAQDPALACSSHGGSAAAGGPAQAPGQVEQELAQLVCYVVDSRLQAMRQAVTDASGDKLPYALAVPILPFLDLVGAIISAARQAADATSGSKCPPCASPVPVTFLSFLAMTGGATRL